METGRVVEKKVLAEEPTFRPVPREPARAERVATEGQSWSGPASEGSDVDVQAMPG